MDPDANITEQISLIDGIIANRSAGRSSRRPKARYDELRRAYSEWREVGGGRADVKLLARLHRAQQRLASA